jgi:uncharacterized protein YigA (DUF484 family)
MDRAAKLAPAEAAAEAVKAFLRIHRSRIADDPELLALLLPARFGDDAKVSDYQRYAIDRLLAENAALRAERDGLRRVSDGASLRRESVRKLVLDLISARSLGETMAIVAEAAPRLGGDAVVLGVEAGAPRQHYAGAFVSLPPGLVDSLIERDAVGALVRGASHPELFPDHEELLSTAIFRLRIGPRTPPALYAVASLDPTRFDDEGETREIAYFTRALERTIGAWLDRSRS